MRIGISLKTLTVTRPINGILNVFPNFHGITLHDHISVLARNTRIHEGEQHLRREDKTLRAPKVVLHLRRIGLQSIEHPLHLGEHIVECNKAVCQCDALRTRM